MNESQLGLTGGETFNNSPRSSNSLEEVVSVAEKKGAKKKKRTTAQQLKIDERSFNNLLSTVELTNPKMKKYSPETEYKTVIDRKATIEFLHIDPSMIKFIQEGMLKSKGAYISPLVAQIRFFFLFKNIAFQTLLQTLPYNPQV